MRTMLMLMLMLMLMFLWCWCKNYDESDGSISSMEREEEETFEGTSLASGVEGNIIGMQYGSGGWVVVRTLMR